MAFCTRIIFQCGIDKAYPQKRKNVLQVAVHLNVVAAQAADIFHQNCGNLTLSAIGDKPLESRAVKVLPAVAIIDVLQVRYIRNLHDVAAAELRHLADVPEQELPLVFYAV